MNTCTRKSYNATKLSVEESEGEGIRKRLTLRKRLQQIKIFILSRNKHVGEVEQLPEGRDEKE